MSLYAIGDLHLSLGADTNKPMDIFKGGWENYTEKIKEGFSRLTQDDVCVLCGDLSWAMSLEESIEDFLYIDRLPGKKIILKGNHDYWWSTAAKAKRLFQENGITTIDIMHNNCFFYGKTALCGTRGWFYEEETGGKQDKKIMDREVMRLETSLKAARDAEEKICFFHYPPRFRNYVCNEIIDMMKTYGVKKCLYGHIHGNGHRFAVEGELSGIDYRLVSADYVKFTPLKVI